MVTEHGQAAPGGEPPQRSWLLQLRTGLLIKGLVVLLVIVYLGLVAGAAVQARSVQALRKEVDILRDTIGQASMDVRAVESRLRQVEERRAQGARLVPAHLAASQVVDLVMSEARRAKVEVRDIKARAPDQEKLNDRVYETHRYALVAFGAREQLLTFVRNLDTASMDTLVLKSASLSQASDAPSLNLTFVVYTQPGADEIAVRGDTPPAPTSQAVMRDRARLLAVIEQNWRKGGWDLVINVLTELRDPAVPSEALDALLYQAYMAGGQDMARSGDKDGAARRFQAALALRPNDVEAEANLGQLQEANRGR